jgi:hypothetical protein
MSYLVIFCMIISLKLNDIKTHVDHETKRMPSSCWNEVGNTANCCAEDDNCQIKIVMDPNDQRLHEYSIDLSTYDSMDRVVCKKNVEILFKIRKEIKDMMTTSGEHNNDSFYYI